ncbi:aminopeptidase [Dokdonia pacifica]|uniref:Peptidase family M1 n=1 Tax=Dokdonia pacifica TaxID=1627892 RepID=A0A239BQC8_9FLAO|nr:M1 family metallopeptidase [Dokdonia pacifica]GGG28336.1 aminopeptidase [Dokdonia pacifica]SNS09581.1 Peptidase family M1 [Dokdonia pacifica]
MIRFKYALCAMLFLCVSVGYAQEEERQGGHENENKFRQLYNEMSTPNSYRTASGAPGHEYYQNEADYKMSIQLDDASQRITGYETITYRNNSPDDLEYLWVQLDQNIRAQDSPAKDKNGGGVGAVSQPGSFVSSYMTEGFDGGFNVNSVTYNGKPLKHTINFTMMRVDMPEVLKSGDSFEFSIQWDYNIPDHTVNRARSGYETYKDGNKGYIIAQFFPRMAVYNDVEGWQNYQFWGNGEFALPFGDYEVDITVPADHLLDGTGEITNLKEVYSKEEYKRWENATKSFNAPVIIRTQAEAEQIAAGNSTKTKTWKLKAKNVRDFAFTSSRRYIMDAQAVRFPERNVMAISIYPPEGNPLWEEYSTKAVVQTLETYSKFTFDYPYPKAISVHAQGQGMEYPMICWNYGRPNEDGTYSDRTKYGMISVIIHEVGHNYFPMIVNSDERQWGWMDEGLDTFMQYLTEQEFGENFPEAIGDNKAYPSRRGAPSRIVNYMKGNQDFISPIMSNPENVYQLGNNAYGKPATALNILRETVMGRELFDHAFKTYAQRWMFKHPTPEDFFRTMEDASAVDLDWYWRGWFYSTESVDIGVKEVKSYYVTDKVTKAGKERLARFGITDPSTIDAVYVVDEDSEDFDPALKGKSMLENSETLKEYLMDNFTPEERAAIKEPKHLYKIVFEKPGGIPMPIIVEYEYADGTKEKVTYPAQIWRKNDSEVSKAIASDKEIVKVTIDPDLETADIDTANNSWPKAKKLGKFEKFKENVKG